MPTDFARLTEQFEMTLLLCKLQRITLTVDHNYSNLPMFQSSCCVASFK